MYHISWCRISSINSVTWFHQTGISHFQCQPLHPTEAASLVIGPDPQVWKSEGERGSLAQRSAGKKCSLLSKVHIYICFKCSTKLILPVIHQRGELSKNTKSMEHQCESTWDVHQSWHMSWTWYTYVWKKTTEAVPQVTNVNRKTSVFHVTSPHLTKSKSLQGRPVRHQVPKAFSLAKLFDGRELHHPDRNCECQMIETHCWLHEWRAQFRCKANQVDQAKKGPCQLPCETKHMLRWVCYSAHMFDIACNKTALSSKA